MDRGTRVRSSVQPAAGCARLAIQPGVCRQDGTPNPSVNTRLVARACLNCHNAIHGSNAPGARGQFFTR
jgi:hypothetical protein